MTQYVHEVVGCGVMFIEENGEVIEIRRGDPRYDNLAEKYAKHLANSLVETTP